MINMDIKLQNKLNKLLCDIEKAKINWNTYSLFSLQGVNTLSYMDLMDLETHATTFSQEGSTTSLQKLGTEAQIVWNRYMNKN